MNAAAKKYLHIVKSLEPHLREIGESLSKSSGNIAHSLKLHSYDIVTEWDVNVEKKLINILKELDPDTHVIGEECGGQRDKKRYWLIDPIDGTLHFVRGNPFSTIMLALIEDDEPKVGIIYNFSNQNLYYAIRGYGAFKNDTPISVSQRQPHEAVVFTEINVNYEKNRNALCNIATQYKHLHLICSGYEFAMIAEGRAEARVCIDPFGNDYDFAAGVVLVQEAGGIAKNLDRSNYNVKDSNFIVASSERVYESILSSVSDKTKNREQA